MYIIEFPDCVMSSNYADSDDFKRVGTNIVVLATDFKIFSWLCENDYLTSNLLKSKLLPWKARKVWVTENTKLDWQ